ncbi:hypothetical protein R1sor_027066 [Riccia sorocarpa]|uniref:CCHC-type domain-containing protein n=1 Tax=Riccia sorocarpa TaxID=122646 RepID=A0ABD3GD70_9MARC
MAGTTERGESKFQNIRGCVLMDMSKPLPTVMHLRLNGVNKRIAIKYDTLPDACYMCQERGHFARSCPKRDPGSKAQTTQDAEVDPNAKTLDPQIRGGDAAGSDLEEEAEELPDLNTAPIDGMITLASWNVNGLGDEDKIAATRRWLNSTSKDVRILALQELKAMESTLEWKLT